jgi:hypothetical protein
LPAAPPNWNIKRFMNESNSHSGKKVDEGFCYNSGTNPDFLSVEELRTLIRSELG